MFDFCRMFVAGMKREITISLIVGAVATAGTLISLKQCSSPDRDIVIREHIRTDTLRIAADTVVLPGTVTVAPTLEADDSFPPFSESSWTNGQGGNTRGDSSSLRTLRDSLALLRDRLACTFDALAGLATVTARGDSVLDRSVLLRRGEMTHTLTFKDTLHVEYAFPPENRFTIAHGAAEFDLPPDTVTTVEYESRPWWIDLVIGMAGAAVSWLAGQVK